MTECRRNDTPMREAGRRCRRPAPHSPLEVLEQLRLLAQFPIRRYEEARRGWAAILIVGRRDNAQTPADQIGCGKAIFTGLGESFGVLRLQLDGRGELARHAFHYTTDVASRAGMALPS